MSALVGLALLAVVAAVLVVVNPVFNPGPLFFRQERMGRHGRRFVMWKFRTMTPAPAHAAMRAPDAPLEEERITALGRALRRTRLDELPNFINVLRGEMALVGPRPDAWEHARHHAAVIPRYHHRFDVRPGITGLAQVRGGYADSPWAVRRKAHYDSVYVRRRSIRLDLYIMLRTVVVMLRGIGAK